MSCWESLFGWFVHAHFHTEIPRKSSCVLGRSGVAAARPWFSAWRSGMYSSSYFSCPKIGIQWISMVWFTQENDYHAFYPGLYNLYIIVNMDAMKYRRTRGFTHLDDMGMHGLHLVCQAMPSFQNLQHIGKDRIIREVISHKFCRMNRLFFGIRPTRVPSLSNTQIVHVWYVCWGWKGLRSCHLP